MDPVAIVLGACLSALLSPTLGLVSGAAFLLSELADYAVYTPLRTRSWLLAVVASNVLGTLVDSTLFVWWVFGSADLWPGQVVGKLTTTALVVPWWWLVRRRYAARLGRAA